MTDWTKTRADPPPPLQDWELPLPNSNHVRVWHSGDYWRVAVHASHVECLPAELLGPPPFRDALERAADWLRSVLTLIDVELEEESPQGDSPADAEPVAVSGERREARRDLAAEQFPGARGIAERAGVTLRRFTEAHYQLRGPRGKWIINIDPGNRRMFHDQHKRGPYLEVSAEWTLLEVVHAALRAMEKETAQ